MIGKRIGSVFFLIAPVGGRMLSRVLKQYRQSALNFVLSFASSGKEQRPVMNIVDKPTADFLESNLAQGSNAIPLAQNFITRFVHFWGALNCYSSCPLCTCRHL